MHLSKEMRRHNYLINEIEAVYHEISVKFGLSDSVMSILYAICDNGEGCLLQDVIRCSGISKQTVNSALRRLESEEIIYLEPVNAKSKKLFLTKKGKQLAENTAGQVLKIEDKIIMSWEKADREKYLELTERYLIDLKKEAEQL